MRSKLLLLFALSGAAAKLPSKCVGVEVGFNYEGNDLPPSKGLPADTDADCCDACNAVPACLFFTFNPQGGCSGMGCCHLKTSKAGRHPKGGVTSGQSLHPPTLPTPAPTPRPEPPAPGHGLRNVLWLQADDLRPNLGAAYTKSWMLTPHMDELAARSLIFRRAFVQQQVCSPSRNAYMTGRRPDRTKTWNFIDDFRIARDVNNEPSNGNGASWATLPGYFRAQGYNVFGSGKTFVRRITPACRHCCCHYLVCSAPPTHHRRRLFSP